MSDDAPTTDTPAAWTCPRCDEPVDAGFDQCWNCGSDHQGNVDPDFTPHVGPRHEQSLCDNCGYPLWNLDRPRCPECGRDFDPTERDTIAPAEGPSPAVQTKRHCLLLGWIASLVTAAVLAFNVGGHASPPIPEPILLILILALIAGIIVLPLLLVWSLLYDR